MSELGKAFGFLLGWVVFIFVMLAVNKTAIGHRIIVYTLWLSVLFVLVTQYKVIVQLWSQ